MLLATVLGAPPTRLSPSSALLGAAFGALGIGASVALFVASLRRIGAARAAAIFGTYPVIGVVASVAFLGERPSPWVLAAVAAMAGGVLLVARDVGRGRARERADAPGSA
jgi:drug/metabolite transporter (DMT)-like permease